MTTLTDRYVWAVTRLLPESQREEIDLELRSSIDDMIEARTSAGHDRAAPDRSDQSDGLDPPDRPDRPDGPDRSVEPARPDRPDVEAEVLLDLGDPNRLAARYVEPARFLIGPERFPEYLHVLKLIAAVAIPLVALGSGLSALLEGDAGGAELIGPVLSGVSLATVHVGFWVTLFYAVREWTGQEREWTLDALPEGPPSRHVTLSDTVFDVAVVAVTIGALLWDRSGPFADGVSLVHPSVYDGWIYPLVGVLLAGGAVALAAYRTGRWTAPLVAANVAVNAGLIAVVAWLAADDRVLNPRFLEVTADRAGWSRVPDANPWVAVLLIGAVAVWDSVECIRKARAVSR